MARHADPESDCSITRGEVPSSGLQQDARPLAPGARVAPASSWRALMVMCVALGLASAAHSGRAEPVIATANAGFSAPPWAAPLPGGELELLAQATDVSDDDSDDPISGGADIVDDAVPASKPAPTAEPEDSEREQEAAAKREAAEARKQAAEERRAAAAAKREEQAAKRREQAEARKAAAAEKREQAAKARAAAAEDRKLAAAARKEAEAAKREELATKRREAAAARKEAAAAKREELALAKRAKAEAAAAKREEQAAAKREAAQAAAAKREEQAAAKREAVAAAQAEREQEAKAKREAAEAEREQEAAAKREAAEATRAKREELAAAREAADANPSSSGAGVGTLRINSRPWAHVFVDGSLVGNTPQLGIYLKPGAHEVRLVNPQFAMQKTFKIQMHAGESLTRSENLEEP